MTINQPAGMLIDSAELPAALWPAGTGYGYRVSYRGKDYNGEDRPVTGSVFVPGGTAPAGGWPVVSYAHGTVGLGDQVAPSRAGLWRPEREFLAGWLAAGYVVAVTDYEGLGTPGPHPYLNGRACADDTIDVVRAAGSLGHPLAPHWVVAGISQGGHVALFTAAIATAYAPELAFLGTIALAPPSDLVELFRGQTADGAAKLSPMVLLLLSGLSPSHPGFDPRDHLPDAGDRLADVAERESLFGVLRAGLDVTNDEAGLTGIFDRPQVKELLAAAEIPALRLDRPVYLAHGSRDEAIPLAFSVRLADKLRRAGSDVQFTTVDGATHVSILAAVQDDTIGWANRLPRCSPPRSR